MSASPIMMPLRRLGILPRVWATASLASVAERVGERKRPHCLRLMRASEDVSLEKSKTQRTPEPGLEFYRKYTEGLLRRYMKMSLESGRAPSLLGRELFRGDVTNYTMHGFDDSVIFVHDVGRCLEQLDPGLRHLVRRIALEEYTLAETAAMLGIHMKTVIRRYTEAIDKLTRLLIDRRILQPMMAELEAN
jgi:hypothetical protein